MLQDLGLRAAFFATHGLGFDQTLTTLLAKEGGKEETRAFFNNISEMALELSQGLLNEQRTSEPPQGLTGNKPTQ